MNQNEEIDEILRQAEDELCDASILLSAKKPALNIAFYHLAQFVEKIISAVYAQMFMNRENLKTYAKLGKILEYFPEIAQTATDVEPLLSYGTPSKNEKTDLKPERVIKSVIDLRGFFYGKLSREAPPIEIKIPKGDVGEGVEMEVARERSNERKTRQQSYIKNYFFCTHCGVKVPITKQTYRGTTCPFCSRQLVMKQG